MDELVHNEAQWIIDTHLDYSFPALKDSIPTKRSKWVESYLASDSLAFIEQEVKKNIRIIKGNETQMEAIREKAKQQGKTLEQAIRDDAHWIVNYQIQQGTLNRTEATKESNTETENHGIQ